MASDKITAIDKQIAELTELRHWLSTTVANWNSRLERTPSERRAGLLESLALQELPNHRQSKGSNHETNLSHVSSGPRPRRIRPDPDELPHAQSTRNI
jgi:hypothetical protein